MAAGRVSPACPQTNGIVERFHKTMLDEFYRIAFRKKLYASIYDLQTDLDSWMVEYNQARRLRSRSPFTHRFLAELSCFVSQPV